MEPQYITVLYWNGSDEKPPECNDARQDAKSMVSAERGVREWTPIFSIYTHFQHVSLSTRFTNVWVILFLLFSHVVIEKIRKDEGKEKKSVNCPRFC